MKITAPCKDCTDRYAGCHGKCDKYKSFRDGLDEHNIRVREHLGKENFVIANA